MKKQTAVEWLITRLYPTIIIRLNESYIKEITDKAKETEKQQIKEFFFKGDSFSCSCYDSATDEDFEEYYNKTFN
jgi:hypothetical protein